MHSSPLYSCCQNHVELMKILIDSLVWLLFWKIIIKTFARLWSNPCFEFAEVTPQLQGELVIFIAPSVPNEGAGRTVVLAKMGNSPLLTAGTDACIYRVLASHHFHMAIWSCAGDILTPWRFSPLPSGSHKWKQVLIHQRILSVVLITSFCYSWQMARFLQWKKNHFLADIKYLCFLMHLSQNSRAGKWGQCWREMYGSWN